MDFTKDPAALKAQKQHELECKYELLVYSFVFLLSHLLVLCLYFASGQWTGRETSPSQIYGNIEN